jgi:hypothetical protein
MGRRSPPVCKRRGCGAGRERWQFVCDDCWSDVPADARQRYIRARRAKLTRIAGEIRRELLRLLGRKPAEASPASPQNTFTNIARLTGDRDALEPAE